MIISNYIRKIFRTWFNRIFGLLSIVVFSILIQSCSNGKSISSDTKGIDTLPSDVERTRVDLSISPNHFRAEALLMNAHVDAWREKLIYTLRIENVLERGSALIRIVAPGDSIHVESALSSVRLQKGDQLIVLVEERMQLNSEIPLFILRSIRKK